MRMGRWLVIEDLPGDGVRLRARDWPRAPWVALPGLLLGVPVFVWALFTGHWVETGGGLVLAGIGGFAAWLDLRGRRTVEIRTADGGGWSADVRSGVGPLARASHHLLAGGGDVVVEPFARPPGAPDLPDRGGDLLLVADGLRIPLVRVVGPAGRQLPAARQALLAAIGRISA